MCPFVKHNLLGHPVIKTWYTWISMKTWLLHLILIIIPHTMTYKVITHTFNMYHYRRVTKYQHNSILSLIIWTFNAPDCLEAFVLITVARGWPTNRWMTGEMIWSHRLSEVKNTILLCQSNFVNETLLYYSVKYLCFTRQERLTKKSKA